MDAISKTELKNAFLGYWQQRYNNGVQFNQYSIHEKLKAVAKDDQSEYNLEHMDDAEAKEFTQYIATLPPAEVEKVIASKQSFEKHLKEAQAVVDSARIAYPLYHAASNKSELIPQALANLDGIITAFKDKPFYEELKALIDKYKTSLQAVGT